MSIHFHNEDVRHRLREKRIAAAWIRDAILQEGKSPGDLNIILCSDTFLHKMNREYLKHDYYTDIITFDFSTEELTAGDLYISIDRIKDNAKQLSINSSDELYRVIIHGIMHLCGYKDKSESQQKEMRSKENFYLEKLRKIQKNRFT